MAVANQTPYKEYIGNGTTKIFPLEFDCDDADHLIVKVNDIEVPALNNWSLNTNTGSVVFAIAPISQSKIIIQRDTPLVRDTDYQTYNNSFRPQPVNKDFDRIWLKLQELGHRDQLIWLALVKEIADRIAGDKNLQNQINAIDSWLEDLQQNVNENTSDIAQLINDLSKEIADRITNDLILKDMFLTIIDTAINEGTVNALAITHVDNLDELNSISNLWEGRTVYVKNNGIFKFSKLQNIWIKDEPYNVYNFKTEQHLQWYFNKYGNWDDAIFEAQCNIFKKSYSPSLRLPSGIISISKPIFASEGLRTKLTQLRPDIALPEIMPPLILVGCPRMTEGRPESHLGTQIVFNGFSGNNDMTWMNFGIIHSAPQNHLDFQNPNFSLGSRVVLKDLNIMPSSPNGDQTVHGIVIRSGNQHVIDNVTVYACNGAGLFLDWVFDSSVFRITVIKCGRMSKNRDTYINEDKTDIQYQTYAPIHVHASTTATDNSNFIYFQKVHLEDNNNANADIIVTGNSDPVVFRDVHHETDGYGVAAKSNKSCFALGGYGVKYFGQDSEDGFDYKNFEKTTKSGHVVLDKATLYTSGYSAAGYQTAWSHASLKNCGMSLPLYVQSYNSSGGVTLDHSTIGDFVHTGFTDRGTVLSANHSTIGDIKLGNDNGSGGSATFTSSTCGRMSIGSNSTGSWANSREIRATNTSFTSITGSYPNFTGDISLTSEYVLSDFTVRLNADIDIRKYAYFENMGGV